MSLDFFGHNDEAKYGIPNNLMCFSGRISASRRRSLNIKCSAELALKNNLLTLVTVA